MAIFDKVSGIEVTSGFKFQSTDGPLDVRLVVDYYNELGELVEGNGAYVGMMVYVKNETIIGNTTYPKGYYSYDGETWTDFKGAADRVQVNLGDGTKPYATITISTDEPTSGNNGDIWLKY